MTDAKQIVEVHQTLLAPFLLIAGIDIGDNGRRGRRSPPGALGCLGVPIRVDHASFGPFDLRDEVERRDLGNVAGER